MRSEQCCYRITALFKFQKHTDSCRMLGAHSKRSLRADVIQTVQTGALDDLWPCLNIPTPNLRRRKLLSAQCATIWPGTERQRKEMALFHYFGKLWQSTSYYKRYPRRRRCCPYRFHFIVGSIWCRDVQVVSRRWDRLWGAQSASRRGPHPKRRFWKNVVESRDGLEVNGSVPFQQELLDALELRDQLAGYTYDPMFSADCYDENMAWEVHVTGVLSFKIVYSSTQQKAMSSPESRSVLKWRLYGRSKVFQKMLVDVWQQNCNHTEEYCYCCVSCIWCVNKLFAKYSLWLTENTHTVVAFTQ